ncbi:MAG: hypothetical protein BWX44_01745 [Spirochaetes bacterium ADurb.Bin001]|nr:MAG: hypothetical protein BWX44_01745 [Spirochaetes bacterium ADurb.Bin001]
MGFTMNSEYSSKSIVLNFSFDLAVRRIKSTHESYHDSLFWVLSCYFNNPIAGFNIECQWFLTKNMLSSFKNLNALIGMQRSWGNKPDYFGIAMV